VTLQGLCPPGRLPMLDVGGCAFGGFNIQLSVGRVVLVLDLHNQQSAASANRTSGDLSFCTLRCMPHSCRHVYPTSPRPLQPHTQASTPLPPFAVRTTK
jgi:hypothetical protein